MFLIDNALIVAVFDILIEGGECFACDNKFAAFNEDMNVAIHLALINSTDTEHRSFKIGTCLEATVNKVGICLCFRTRRNAVRDNSAARGNVDEIHIFNGIVEYLVCNFAGNTVTNESVFIDINGAVFNCQITGRSGSFHLTVKEYCTKSNGMTAKVNRMCSYEGTGVVIGLGGFKI